MKKWFIAVTFIGAATFVGFVVRQVACDLSDNADMWRSVTDNPEL